ncbi:MAG: hypothetical protein M3282_12985, partial [Gemmatimonadota bacterium]|nr:hypothetical protein [Gemmatimonadota bacterium]
MGILDRFRCKQPNETNAANALAMVLLPDQSSLDGQAVLDYLKLSSDLRSAAAVPPLLVSLPPLTDRPPGPE